MRTAKFALTAAAVAAFGLASVSDVAAQVCTGVPTLNGQRAISAGVGFPQGGTSYGARLDVNTTGPLAAHVGYNRSEWSGAANASNSLGAGVAYQLPAPLIAGEVAVSGCPAVSAVYTLADGQNNQSRLDVPVGFGVGTRLSLGAGMNLVPYVMPQVIFSRTMAADQALQSTQTAYGATVGSALDFGAFYAGVDMATTRVVDVPGTQSQVGVRLGVKF